MPATIDFQAVLPRTRNDISGLGPFLKQLIGQPFLFARESYSDELTFHFGKPVPANIGCRAPITEGEYVLTTRASDWWIASAPLKAGIGAQNFPVSPGVKRTSLADLETAPPITPGACIGEVQVQAFHGDGGPGGIQLLLRFSDNSLLLIEPEYAPNEANSDLADWELFTPHGRYLRAGPGVQWEYADSTQPSNGVPPPTNGLPSG